MRECKGCGIQFKGRATRVYCSLACQRSLEREQRIAQWLATGTAYPGSGRDHYVRTYLFSQQDGLCDICGNPALWNGEEMAFVMDHIDGDPEYNSRQNLRLICPNCDSQLPTYKSHNRHTGAMDLLDQPHHDGSPLYVDLPTDPSPDQLITVRARTSQADRVSAVWVRTTTDAEPIYRECVVSQEKGLSWWEAQVPLHNPVMHYRFLLLGADGSQRWLTGAGTVGHDVPDAFDFTLTWHPPAPDWALDGVVYQVFPDRFARSAAAPERSTPSWAVPAGWEDTVIFEGSDPRTPLQFFGGDLDGITDHLDHIERTGADIVYTTPVFPAESNHRYNASTFDTVDPVLGGDEAYARLADAVHDRGWRILGDLTTNHTGDTHEWFRQAAGSPQDPHRDWYFFNADGSYANWMGHHTLPKLNHANPALRAAFTDGPESVVGRWLQPPFSLDGWRIDVANMTGRLGASDLNHEVARQVRTTATTLNPDALVLGEHNHDASEDVPGDGWHGTMNYSGFSWPVWEWLRSEETAARSFGTPLPIAQRSGPEVVASMRQWMGRYGWRTVISSWNILGSHDSARIRTVTGSGQRHRVAAVLQFTLPGVPMIFAGDEIGLEGVNGEDSRRPMPWTSPEIWDTATLGHYAALAALRSDHAALRRGGLRWVHISDDALVFLREHESGSVLVAVRRSGGSTYTLPVSARTVLLADGHPEPEVGANGLTIPASDGPGVLILGL